MYHISMNVLFKQKLIMVLEKYIVTFQGFKKWVHTNKVIKNVTQIKYKNSNEGNYKTTYNLANNIYKNDG